MKYMILKIQVSKTHRQVSDILIIYLFFIYSWLTANEIIVYNKNSYVYIHANWRQLPNVKKMRNCKINIKKRKNA